MQKVYERIYWENEPSTSTPLSEANLNRIDYALDQVDTRVVELAGYEERAEEAVQQAEAAEEGAQEYKRQAQEIVSSVSSSVEQAEDAALLAESHNHGNTGARAGENTDNSKYWSQQSQAHEQTAAGYVSAVQTAAANAIAALQDALDGMIPAWTVDLTDGHSYYQGGSFNFVINYTDGHLYWEVA